MTEPCPTPWKIYDANDPLHVKIKGQYTDIGGAHVADVLFPANAAFIVKAVNSHDALVKALHLLEKAEEFHANCEECNGEDIPELCEKCFPHYDDARVARRLALGSLAPVGP